MATKRTTQVSYDTTIVVVVFKVATTACRRDFMRKYHFIDGRMMAYARACMLIPCPSSDKRTVRAAINLNNIGT